MEHGIFNTLPKITFPLCLFLSFKENWNIPWILFISCWILLVNCTIIIKYMGTLIILCGSASVLGDLRSEMMCCLSTLFCFFSQRIPNLKSLLVLTTHPERHCSIVLHPWRKHIYFSLPCNFIFQSYQRCVIANM